MIAAFLEEPLRAMRDSLEQRQFWPIAKGVGYDLHDPAMWLEVEQVGGVQWVVQFEGLQLLSRSDATLDTIQACFGLPAAFQLQWGTARPELLWLVRIEGGIHQQNLPRISGCTPLDYLRLEEIWAVVRGLESDLESNN